jgi:two-component system sensor histidine kinase BaeS
MKYKLAYKLFVAFLLTNIVGIVLLVGGMQYFMRQYFFDFVRQIELNKIDYLVHRLADEYRQTGDWEALREKQSHWQNLLKHPNARHPPRPPHEGMGPPPRPPHEGMGPPPRPPHEGMGHPPRPPHEGMRHPPRPPHEGMRPPPMHGGDHQPLSFRPPPELLDKMLSIKDIPGPPVKPIPNSPPDPMMIAPRLTLFDAEKHWVIGRQTDLDNFALRAIDVNGKTVGWVGIQRVETFFAPKDIEFIQQQTRGIYISCLGVLLFSIIVTWLLAQHLVKPLRKLTTATQALAARRFGTRVTVKAQDEVGQLATDFNQMAYTLEQYEQMRQQWLADVAHELRTPLSILRGEVEALQDGIREADDDTLESLHAEALHLTRLVDDLRTLSLADSQALNIRRQPLNPLHVLQQSLNQFQARLVQQKIKLRANLQTKEVPYLAGDSDRLLQVFNNLLENTLRYVDKPGWLKITPTLTPTFLQLDFIDSGPGVPDFALPHLFYRLYRAEPSRNRAQGGTGLGLSICKSIIEMHGGEISAQKAPEGGLWFKISLPVSSKNNDNN